MDGRAGAARLGVVVPALNEAARLPRLLERLRAGPDRPGAVVVVDGGSGDGTAELAEAAGARVLRTGACRGAQLAAGAAELDTELLLFLHADTLPARGALDAAAACLDDARTVACGMHQVIDAPGLVLRLVERFADFRVARLGLVYGDSGLAVRRADYLGCGGFRDLPLFEDVDLARRLRRRGRVRLVRAATLHVSARRWQAEGALRRTVRNWMLTVGYAAGVDPARLARRYAPQTGPGPASGAPPARSPEP